jgi:hypothetical protein
MPVLPLPLRFSFAPVSLWMFPHPDMLPVKSATVFLQSIDGRG